MTLRIARNALALLLAVDAAGAQTVDPMPSRLWFPGPDATISTRTPCAPEAPCPAPPRG